MICLTVPVRGLPQPRPKARRIGPGIQIYTPNSGPIKLYKAAIAEAYRVAAGADQEPFLGPIWLSIRYVFERPQSRMSESREPCHIVKPDLDNLVKGTMDALNEIAWHDDAQIVDLHVTKEWAKTFSGGVSGRKAMSGDSYIEIRIETELDRPVAAEMNDMDLVTF